MGFYSMSLAVLLTAGLSYACQDAIQLPELQRRSRNSKVSGDDPLVNDLFLNTGWYKVTGPSGQYMMPDSNFRPPFDGCGTLNQIYIKETHPVVGSEIPVNVSACVLAVFYDCFAEITISIRNCSGELQYYLPITNIYEAYCFDPPALQQILDFSAAPENFNPGDVIISPKLTWTEENNYNKPELYFECSFRQTEGLFYTVTWRVDRKLAFIKGPNNTTDALQLTADELSRNGFRFGITLQCGVEASVDTTGSSTRSTFSKEFFAGIKILNPSITLNRTHQNVSVEFSSTVPIGCVYPMNEGSCGQRKLSVHMNNIGHNCSGLVFQRCSTGITLLARNDLQTSGAVYKFMVTSNFRFLEPTHLELRLQTGINSWLPIFFTNQSLQTVSVTVDDSADWTPSHCYSHIDPHMKTFDNVHYENQESGDFVLYRNTQYGIEVQERTKPCAGSRAKCTCQVAVRAGGDVFVINRCPDTTWFNEFFSCNDGILDAVKINEKTLKIYTPIGMVVQITDRFNGWLNVDIYSSPKDLNNVKGLCGYYDGNPANDFEMPDGSSATYRNTDYMFSRSWMVTMERGLLTGYKLDHLINWDSINSLACVCLSSTLVGEAYCYKLDTACVYSSSITKKKCNKISNRKKRSLFQHTFNEEFHLEAAEKKEAKLINKRSIGSDPPIEEEVRGHCSNIIRNAPSVTQFPERLMGEDIEAVIQQCVFDVMEADGDLSVGEIHARSLDDVVKQTFSYQPTFIKDNTEMIKSFLQETCPNNCSGRGVCSEDGECICESFYHGPECKLYEEDPINVNLIQGDGICDTALGDDCRCHWFYTNNLLENFSCKFRQFKVDLGNNKFYLDELVVPGEYDDMFTGQCCLPETRHKRSVEPDVLGYEWELAISNDGTHFGRGQTLYTIDQTCLDVVNSSNNERSLMLRDGFCLINLQCVADTEIMVSNQCHTCNVHTDQFGWTNVCMASETPTTSVVGIAVGTAVGAVVVLCVVVWIVWKLNNKKAIVGTDVINERCLDNSRSIYGIHKPANFNSHEYSNDAYTVPPEHPYETLKGDRCSPDLFRRHALTSETTFYSKDDKNISARPGSASGISIVLRDSPID